MTRYKIKHARQGWTACLTWSVERARTWLDEFDARLYTDKALRREDFVAIDTVTGEEVPV